MKYEETFEQCKWLSQIEAFTRYKNLDNDIERSLSFSILEILDKNNLDDNIYSGFISKRNFFDKKDCLFSFLAWLGIPKFSPLFGIKSFYLSTNNRPDICYQKWRKAFENSFNESEKQIILKKCVNQENFGEFSYNLLQEYNQYKKNWVKTFVNYWKNYPKSWNDIKPQYNKIKIKKIKKIKISNKKYEETFDQCILLSRIEFFSTAANLNIEKEKELHDRIWNIFQSSNFYSDKYKGFIAERYGTPKYKTFLNSFFINLGFSRFNPIFSVPGCYLKYNARPDLCYQRYCNIFDGKFTNEEIQIIINRCKEQDDNYYQYGVEAWELLREYHKFNWENEINSILKFWKEKIKNLQDNINQLLNR